MPSSAARILAGKSCLLHLTDAPYRSGGSRPLDWESDRAEPDTAPCRPPRREGGEDSLRRFRPTILKPPPTAPPWSKRASAEANPGSGIARGLVREDLIACPGRAHDGSHPHPLMSLIPQRAPITRAGSRHLWAIGKAQTPCGRRWTQAQPPCRPPSLSSGALEGSPTHLSPPSPHRDPRAAARHRPRAGGLKRGDPQDLVAIDRASAREAVSPSAQAPLDRQGFRMGPGIRPAGLIA